MNSKYAGKIAKLKIGRTHGSFGYYLKVGRNTGVKLVGRCRLWFGDRKVMASESSFRSEKDVKRSRVWKKVQQEALMLKKAEKSKIAPKVYEVGIYKLGKLYFPGIVMEHFNGVKSRWHQDTIRERLIHKLADYGIGYRDHNPDNFLKTAKGWRVIDFSADYTKIIS